MMVTLAPVMTEPVLSEMVPEKIPVACPNNCDHAKRKKQQQERTRDLLVSDMKFPLRHYSSSGGRVCVSPTKCEQRLSAMTAVRTKAVKSATGGWSVRFARCTGWA